MFFSTVRGDGSSPSNIEIGGAGVATSIALVFKIWSFFSETPGSNFQLRSDSIETESMCFGFKWLLTATVRAIFSLKPDVAACVHVLASLYPRMTRHLNGKEILCHEI